MRDLHGEGAVPLVVNCSEKRFRRNNLFPQFRRGGIIEVQSSSERMGQQAPEKCSGQLDPHPRQTCQMSGIPRALYRFGACHETVSCEAPTCLDGRHLRNSWRNADGVYSATEAQA